MAEDRAGMLGRLADEWSERAETAENEVERLRSEAREDYARAEEAEAQVVALRSVLETQTHRPPSARAVCEMVDETAKAEMRRQGRDPEVWDRLSPGIRDDLRLLALDRLRSLP